jgi:hypothetical protein
MAPFKHLIRFRSGSLQVLYGELERLDSTGEMLVGRTVHVFDGDSPWDPNFRLTDREEVVAEVSH